MVFEGISDTHSPTRPRDWFCLFGAVRSAGSEAGATNREKGEGRCGVAVTQGGGLGGLAGLLSCRPCRGSGGRAQSDAVGRFGCQE